MFLSLTELDIDPRPCIGALRHVLRTIGKVTKGWRLNITPPPKVD